MEIYNKTIYVVSRSDKQSKYVPYHVRFERQTLFMNKSPFNDIFLLGSLLLAV